MHYKHFEDKLFVLPLFLKFQTHLSNEWIVSDPGDTKVSAELVSEKFTVNGKKCVQDYKVAYKIYYYLTF